MTHTIIDIKKDPFREREAQKYENPIPSREFIMQHLEELERPASYSHFLRVFGLHREDDQEALRRRLKAMLRDGQLITNRRGSYALVTKLALARGRVSIHKEGFGFLIPDDGSTKIFLPPRQLRSVFDGDKVLANIITEDYGGRREGKIVEVLEHCTTQIAGRYSVEHGVAFVASLNKNVIHDILIPHDKSAGAVIGQMVVAKITSYPTDRRHAIGEIVEILGEHMAPGMEIELAIRAHCLPYIWSKEVLDEASTFSKNVTKIDKKGRKELQALSFVTIDGADAKDFDDAVFCEQIDQSKDWRLYVAIADVSHYVRPNTALDKEAFIRGTSVYFPGNVIPMLPEILSNELCSLRPNVERLTIVCEMVVSPAGIVKRYKFYEAVICSQARLTYDQVLAVLDGKTKQFAALLPHLKELHKVFLALQKQRQKRGALDFEMPETRIIFDKERKIQKIVPFERHYAHQIIEECMLAANVCAANFLSENKVPVLYRVHAAPDEEKLTNLRQLLSGLAIKLGGGSNPKPLDYAFLLKQVANRPDAHMLQMILLRSLKQAIYTPDNLGHFGLAYDAYTHFTSPIRRYPDLLIHRAIRYCIRDHVEKLYPYNYSMINDFGEHCSMTERRADDATRDAVDWLKCEYMLDKVGKSYDGIISGVTNFGVFVELKDIYVEGLVHVTSLKNDYYKFDPIRHRLEGKRSKTSYCIGDPIRVLVARVNLDDRQIDFEICK